MRKNKVFSSAFTAPQWVFIVSQVGDSDWANDSSDRKSQGGYIFKLGNGGQMSWQLRKQDLVAASTLEAEYIACWEASREARWLIQLQKDVNGTNSEPVQIPLIKCDNQGALAIVSTGTATQWTKNIDVCYHNSRGRHACGILEYAYVGTGENTADLFTKPPAIRKHQKFTAAAGLRRFLKKSYWVVLTPFDLYLFRLFSLLWLYGPANPYQATVVLFPCQTVTVRGFNEATGYFIISLFSCIFLRTAGRGGSVA